MKYKFLNLFLIIILLASAYAPNVNGSEVTGTLSSGGNGGQQGSGGGTISGNVAPSGSGNSSRNTGNSGSVLGTSAAAKNSTANSPSSNNISGNALSASSLSPNTSPDTLGAQTAEAAPQEASSIETEGRLIGSGWFWIVLLILAIVGIATYKLVGIRNKKKAF